MILTRKEAVERHCNRIINHVADGARLSGSDLGQIIDTLRALVAERDAARAKALEEAAQTAENQLSTWTSEDTEWNRAIFDASAAIRALAREEGKADV